MIAISLHFSLLEKGELLQECVFFYSTFIIFFLSFLPYLSLSFYLFFNYHIFQIAKCYKSLDSCILKYFCKKELNFAESFFLILWI